MINLITNHVELAKDRLREQYKNSPNILALIEAWVGEIQELEQVLFDLAEKRTISQGEGIQLDKIGELLNKPRDGRSDADYRIVLLAKVAQNISRGTSEDIIGVFKILTSSAKVQFGNGDLGEIYLLADHSLTQDQVNFILREMMTVDSAGVRIGAIGSFDPDDSFSMDGTDLAKGYSSVYDTAKGGKFARIMLGNETKFAFDGANTSLGGYGSIYDNLVGGAFDGL